MLARLRSMSEAVSVLVIVGIAIAVALIAGGIVMSQTRTLASKGATLSLVVDAHDAGNGYTAVTVNVKNNGPEAVRITNVTMYVNGAQVNCTWDPQPSPTTPVTITAGSSASFTTVCYTGASLGAKVTVTVSGYTVLTHTQVSVSGNAEILS